MVRLGQTTPCQPKEVFIDVLVPKTGGPSPDVQNNPVQMSQIQVQTFQNSIDCCVHQLAKDEKFEVLVALNLMLFHRASL